MRIVFMGTPEIAVPVLAKLSEKHEVAGVFCQPDKPVGRKQILTAPPVKVWAEEHGIPVFQPVKLRTGEALKILQDLAPEAIAVIAYGKILPVELLNVPVYGCINAHASLLPKYRGAAPIQRVIMCGETETGVTAMLMDAGMDTGDMLQTVRVPIRPEDDAVSMFEKLGETAAELMDRVFDDLEGSLANRVPQDSAAATLAPMLEKDDGDFSFNEDAEEIFNRIRGTAIWPVARFFTTDRFVKVFSANLRKDLCGAPGEVLALKPLTVAAEGGALELLKVMPQNSKLMDGTAYAAGRRLKAGDLIQ